jgi:hypothetical protein
MGVSRPLKPAATRCLKCPNASPPNSLRDWLPNSVPSSPSVVVASRGNALTLSPLSSYAVDLTRRRGTAPSFDPVPRPRVCRRPQKFRFLFLLGAWCVETTAVEGIALAGGWRQILPGCRGRDCNPMLDDTQPLISFDDQPGRATSTAPKPTPCPTRETYHSFGERRGARGRGRTWGPGCRLQGVANTTAGSLDATSPETT